ncbi:hypothetical protein FPQ18DRAFT_313280 [Pyronema domesticum]|uniref:MARVEL domain-containing protein n=1 Tax=Pyronema omphalodes (strain CBS 100304) TaxID=1076935 RepID=U4LG42_PYROM|nr:hypothetical protein FPQ18DRAFT_313280 [Pyronema domesticum]CCX10584.1 Similar to hypothetical protein [Tuber melanosporum Mel28]; acc. no. XP_002838569 [Pyronema omphalodes CBS 100304]
MDFIAKTLAKTATWFLRMFQNIFALILIGTCGYMLHEFAKFGFRPPQEVVVPMLFSCIALVISFFSLLAICCLPYILQLIAAFFDFMVLSGYIACAVLLDKNYHSDDTKNQLWVWLVSIRRFNNETSLREKRSAGLVKLLVALVILQILLFFATTLLSFYLAMLKGEKVYERAAEREIEYEESEEMSRSGRDVREVKHVYRGA